MLQIESNEEGTTRRLLFSGDIGQWGKPLIGDPSVFSEADYVVMESTYGDREHREDGDVDEALCQGYWPNRRERWQRRDPYLCH